MSEEDFDGGSASTNGHYPDAGDPAYPDSGGYATPPDGAGSNVMADVLATLARHRWATLCTFVLVAGIGAAWVFSRQPVYSCSPAVLQIVAESTRVATVQEVFGGQAVRESYFLTQASLVTLEPVLRVAHGRLSESERMPYAEFASSVVVKPDRFAYLIKVQFESPGPTLNADAANAIAETFVETVRGQREERTSRASSLFARQREGVRKQLDDVDQRIAELRTRSQVANVGAEMARVNARLAAADNAHDAQNVRLIALERSYAEVQRARETGNLELVREVTQHGGYQMIRGAILDAETARHDVLGEFADDSEQVKAWDRRIERLGTQSTAVAEGVVGLIEIEYENATRAKERLRRLRDEVREEQQRLAGLTIELANLDAERTRVLRDRDDLMAQVTAIQGATGFDSSPAILWERARPNLKPISPNLKRDLSIAAVLSVSLALGIAFLLDQMDDAIHRPEDVTRFTGMPILGVLPLVTEEGAEADLASLQDQGSQMAEAVRIIRTGVFHAQPGREDPKVILVTSAEMGEGKTMTAVNLAAAIAQSEKRTLLVDCDLRNPRVHEVFGLDNAQGLTQIFSNGAVLPPAVRPSAGAEFLEVTTAGPRPLHPDVVLGGERMRAFLARAAQDYDHIVIDAPPAAPVSDPATLARYADGVIIVVEANATRKAALKRALAHLLAVGAPVLGVVFNKARVEQSYYYS